MKQRTVFAMGLALAVGGAGSYFGFKGTDARPKPLLQILSPPSAGYDATNVVLYTGSGAAVTVTRASTQRCGSVENGAIHGGDLDASRSNNIPCIVDGSLAVEPAGTNVLLQSRDISTTWTKAIGSETVTTNTWDYGFGNNAGDTVDEASAVAFGGVCQTVSTTTTGAWIASVYTRSGTSAKARIAINVTGGTGSTTCDFSDLSSSTSRKRCSATAGAGVTALQVCLYVGNDVADTGSIKVAEIQLETGTIASSPIATTTTAATRAAQTTTFAVPSTLGRTEGCAHVCITPNWTGAFPGAASAPFLNANDANTARLGFVATGGGDVFQAFDGTTVVAVAAGYTAGVRKCYRTFWSAARNAFHTENLTSGVVGSNSAFSTFPAFSANAYVGSAAAAILSPHALLDDIVLGSHPDGCR